jgi:tetratricopeptide (TPR) repeat protein
MSVKEDLPMFLKWSLKKMTSTKETLQKANDPSVKKLFFILLVLPLLIQVFCGCSLLPVKERSTDGVLSKKEREKLAEELHVKGLTQSAEGKLHEAIRTWQKEIELSPKRVRPYNNIGITYRRLGNLDAAKEFHEKAIKVDPKFGHSYYSLGLVHYDRKHYEEAKRLFLEAIRRGYGDADVHYSLGQAHKNLKEYDQAVQAYEKTVKLFYGYPGAHFQLGECYRVKGKHDLARLEFRREIELNSCYKRSSEIGLQEIEEALNPNRGHKSAFLTATQEKVAEWIDSGLSFIPGNSIDEIKQKLGNPMSERVDPHRNNHVVGQMDQIHTLNYEGLSLRVYRVMEVPPRDLVFELTITDKRFPFKWGLRIGSPRNEVVQALGKPDKDGTPLTYSTEAGLALFFFSRENRLEKVQWQWDID